MPPLALTVRGRKNRGCRGSGNPARGLGSRYRGKYGAKAPSLIKIQEMENRIRDKSDFWSPVGFTQAKYFFYSISLLNKQVGYLSRQKTIMLTFCRLWKSRRNTYIKKNMAWSDQCAHPKAQLERYNFFKWYKFVTGASCIKQETRLAVGIKK